MQPGTALIEIAWPSGHWNFMYATPGMVSFLLQVNPTWIQWPLGKNPQEVLTDKENSSSPMCPLCTSFNSHQNSSKSDEAYESIPLQCHQFTPVLTTPDQTQIGYVCFPSKAPELWNIFFSFLGIANQMFPDVRIFQVEVPFNAIGLDPKGKNLTCGPKGQCTSLPHTTASRGVALSMGGGTFYGGGTFHGG